MHQARLQMNLCGYATRSHRAHLRVAAGSGTCTLTESEVARNRAPMTKLSGVRHGKREFKAYSLALSLAQGTAGLAPSCGRRSLAQQQFQPCGR